MSIEADFADFGAELQGSGSGSGSGSSNSIPNRSAANTTPSMTGPTTHSIVRHTPQPPPPSPPHFSLLGQPLTTILWLGVGCLLLFGLIFWFYYRRRQDTSQTQKEEMLDSLQLSLKEVKDELATLNQKHVNLQGQVRGVSTHARSVEQGLGSALTAWSETFNHVKDQLDSLYEAARARSEDGDEEEDGEQEQDEAEEEEDELVLEEGVDGAYDA